MNNRASVTVWLFAVLVASTGCGKVSLDLNNVLPSQPSVIRMSGAAEFVSGSQQGEKTINNYTVDVSAGAVFSKLESTTPNGYKVYSTVQGAMISEDKAKEAAIQAAR
jgi:hypothetical protein